MGDTSLIEGLAKKFLNLVPRQFYREAAQKLVHEICETIYNETQVPRKEIVDIVIKFINTHLGFEPENPRDNPIGIRDAILDSVSKTTLEVYKDDIVNKLLLQKILLEEFNGNTVDVNGIFYKSLEESILTVKEGIKNNVKKKNEEPLAAVDKSTNVQKLDKQKIFAKNVLAALPNVNITEPSAPTAEDLDVIDGGGGNMIDNIMPLAGTAMLAASMAKDAGIIGNKSENGGNSTTNIGYEPNKNGVLPYIQTNCNGSGLGLPGIDLNFLGKLFDGLKEPIAEELIKKIQERLPDYTIDSITVKRNIYDKILKVIQAHLQSQLGKNMLLDTIKPMIEPEIKFLTKDIEIKKRLIKVIFKNKSSEIYKKLIDIIAQNTTEATSPTDNKQANNNTNFTMDISKVIQQFNEFINSDINMYNGFPEVKNSIKEAALAQFKIALDEQQKNIEKDAKNNEENAKKANEETIKNIAVGMVNTKIDEIKQKEEEIKNRTLIIETNKPIKIDLPPIIEKDKLQEIEKQQLQDAKILGKGIISNNGGNPTKNKTKRRRTKNNTKKMKQKRRTIKKT